MRGEVLQIENVILHLCIGQRKRDAFDSCADKVYIAQILGGNLLLKKR